MRNGEFNEVECLILVPSVLSPACQTRHRASSIEHLSISDFRFGISDLRTSPEPCAYALCLLFRVSSNQYPVSSIYNRVCGFYLTNVYKLPVIWNFATVRFSPILVPSPLWPVSNLCRFESYSGWLESYLFYQAAQRCSFFVKFAESFGPGPD